MDLRRLLRPAVLLVAAPLAACSDDDYGTERIPYDLSANVSPSQDLAGRPDLALPGCTSDLAGVDASGLDLTCAVPPDLGH